MNKKKIRGILFFSIVIAITFFTASFAVSFNDIFSNLVIKEIVKRDPTFSDSKVEVIVRKISKNLPSNITRFNIALDYPLNMPLSGRVIIPLIVSNKDGFSDKVLVESDIRIFRKVVVTKQAVKKGEKFDASNVEYLEKEVTFLPKNYLLNISEVIGKTSTTYLPKGKIVLDWMLTKTPLIKKGDVVSLFKAINGVLVRVNAIAIEDGYLNGNIKVRNLESKKIVEGKVVGSSEVEAL